MKNQIEEMDLELEQVGRSGNKHILRNTQPDTTSKSIQECHWLFQSNQILHHRQVVLNLDQQTSASLPRTMVTRAIATSAAPQIPLRTYRVKRTIIPVGAVTLKIENIHTVDHCITCLTALCYVLQ